MASSTTNPKLVPTAAARRRAAVLLFIAISSLYLVTTRGKTGGGDTGWRWYMGHQIAHFRSPVINGPANQPPHPTHRWWLGDPLLMAGGDFIAQGLHALVHRLPEQLTSQAIACFGQALSAGLLVVLLMLWLTDLGHSLPVAVGAAALLGTGTLLWKYTTDVFYELHQALYLLSALYTAWIAARHSSTRWLALSTACFSMAWMTKISSLSFLPAIVWVWYFTPEEGSPRQPGFLPLRTDRLKQALAVVPIFLPFWLAEVGFDFWRFGHWPVSIAERDPSYTSWGFANLPAGLWDVTFGAVRGLAWYGPLTILSLAFLPQLFRRMKTNAWAILYCLVSALAVSALVEGFKNDQAWGPRSFIVVTPLVGLLLAEWLSDWRRLTSVARVASVVIFCYALGLQVMSTTVSHTRWFIERDANRQADLPPPPPMYFAQPHFAALVFSNYFAGRSFRERRSTDTAADSRAWNFSYNYPNYWWALPVALGASRWPLLAGMLFLLAISLAAWYKLARFLVAAKSLEGV